jgi:hypothetical protein
MEENSFNWEKEKSYLSTVEPCFCIDLKALEF